MLNSLSTDVSSRQAAAVPSVSFQNVWDSQAGRSGTPQSASPEKTAVKEQPVKGEALQNKGVRELKSDRVKPSASAEAQPEEQPEEIPEEKLALAMEALGTEALRFLQQIADTLGLEEGQMQELLGQLDMAPEDLLIPENLSAFLLAAGGAQDTLSLITDEGLYADYRSLMGELQELLQQDSGVDGMTLEELSRMVEQSAEKAPVEEALPELAQPQITVTVEREEPEQKPLWAGRQETDASESADQDTRPQTAEEQTVREPVRHTERRHPQGGEHPEHGGQQGGSLFQPGPEVDSTELSTAQTDGTAARFGVDTQDIMRQIMDYMRIQVRADLSSLEMQLHPASLGTLQISVAAKGGVITANFVAQNEAVKAALESQMVQLRESFAEQGVKVEAIEVTVQSHAFEQNLEQGRERGQETAPRSQRPRRLRLDSLMDPEELQELPQEEQLAAEMMAANGTTVDYTA